MVGVLSVLKSGSVVPVRSAPQGITGEWRDERGRLVENPKLLALQPPRVLPDAGVPSAMGADEGQDRAARPPDSRRLIPCSRYFRRWNRMWSNGKNGRSCSPS